jgi:transposase
MTTPTEDELMQHGYSKDHRPDLPQNHPDTLLLLMLVTRQMTHSAYTC